MPTWQRTRTFRYLVLRMVVLRASAFVAVAGVILFGQALAAHSPARSAAVPVEQVVDTPPVWTTADAAAHPGCVPLQSWPAGKPAPYVVVQSVRDTGHQRVAFDVAWQENHNATEADDVWVLGVCGRHH